MAAKSIRNASHAAAASGNRLGPPATEGTIAVRDSTRWLCSVVSRAERPGSAATIDGVAAILSRAFDREKGGPIEMRP